MELKQVHTTPNYNIPPRVSPLWQVSTASLYLAPVGLHLTKSPRGTSTNYFFKHIASSFSVYTGCVSSFACALKPLC